MASGPSYEQCQRIIHSLMIKHDWHLLDEEEFTSRVFTHSLAENAGEDQAIRAIAINAYCQQWYIACKSEAERRERAFAEVWRYLFNIAFNKYKDEVVAQEISQSALILVWEKLDTCHNPGAFLSFCLYKLKNAETIYQRAQVRKDQETPLYIEEEYSEETTESSTKDPLSPEPGHEIDCTERYTELLQSFASVYTQSPRAKRQLDVVFYTGFVGLTSKEIAEKLGIEPSQVHELRARGVKLLRQYSDFSSKLQDFVVNCL